MLPQPLPPTPAKKKKKTEKLYGQPKVKVSRNGLGPSFLNYWCKGVCAQVGLGWAGGGGGEGGGGLWGKEKGVQLCAILALFELHDCCNSRQFVYLK